MMAASQPFLSGGISKTVNLPANSTIEDIQDAYMLGWKLGLKSVAIYRDNSKGSQPLNIKKAMVESKQVGSRRKLPDTRESLTHKFTINGHKGYFTVGLYPDGQPGELFISVAKEGSTLGGIFDCFGLATSIGLQYGVPLSEFIDKFTHVRFEPAGFTKNPEIKIAKSIIDYIFRWLAIKFTTPVPNDVNEPTVGTLDTPEGTLDAPICGQCGTLTTRVGACFLCYGCGTSGGCS
jgi:ribonucleoside-diphosphate reductase alpha chain